MTKKRKIKVIIDTNLWISFLIGKKLQILKRLIVNDEITIIICDQLIEEIVRVAARPRLQKYFQKRKVDELVDFLRLIRVHIKIKSVVNICRDEKDNFLFSLAEDSSADLIITGDHDVLSVEKYKNTEIINYKEFEKRMSSSD